MATAADKYAGEHCERLGLSIDQFYCGNQTRTKKITDIKKGPIYELSQVRKSRGTPWKEFYDLMRAVCDASFTVAFESFKVMVGRLKLKEREISSYEIRKRKKSTFCLKSHFVAYTQFLNLLLRM